MPFDLKAEIARRLNVSREAVAPVLDAVIERIRQQVSHFGYARMAGLGTFRSQNGHLSFEPETVLSDEVNVRFAGLTELSVEAPSLLESEDQNVTSPSFADIERHHSESDAADLDDFPMETDVADVFANGGGSEHPEEEIEDGEGEPPEIDEGTEKDDAEYGESPGEDYERSDSGTEDAVSPDEKDASVEPIPPAAVRKEDADTGDTSGTETPAVIWDASRGPASGTEDDGDLHVSADAVDDADPEDRTDVEGEAEIEDWADVEADGEEWVDEIDDEFQAGWKDELSETDVGDEDDIETWQEHPEEKHPLGPPPEPPFEEADFSVLDERHDATSKPREEPDEDVESARKAPDDEFTEEDISDEDFVAGFEIESESDYDRVSDTDAQSESDDISPVESDVDREAGRDHFQAEDEFLIDETFRTDSGNAYVADEGDYPADEDDYPADEDDYPADEEDQEDHDFSEGEDSRTPSVEWNTRDDPAVSDPHEHDAESGEESEEEEAGVYAASGSAAGGLAAFADEGAIEDDASHSGLAEEDAAAGGAVHRERLRQPSERRHAAARATGSGAAGENRNAIWIGVGVLVLVAAAAVIYFSMTPSGTPKTPSVAEERAAPAPVDTSAAAGAGISSGDASAADTADTAPSAAAPVEDDPDPLRSPQGLDLPTGGYTLVVYSETSESGAENVRAQFRENGFRTSVLEDREGATTRYRVGVGQFATLDEAVEARDRLAGNELPSDAWVRRIQ